MQIFEEVLFFKATYKKQKKTKKQKEKEKQGKNKKQNKKKQTNINSIDLVSFGRRRLAEGKGHETDMTVDTA